MLLVDVKGDLPNLALAFPSFDPAAMAPRGEPGAGEEDGLADEPLVREAVETRSETTPAPLRLTPLSSRFANAELRPRHTSEPGRTPTGAPRSLLDPVPRAVPPNETPIRHRHRSVPEPFTPDKMVLTG